MNDVVEAAPAAARPVLTQTQVDPPALLAMAVQQGADLDRLERLMALQERWEANEARKAFVIAMTRFKAEPLEIFKRKFVGYDTKDGDQVGYKHATLSDVTDVVVPAMAAHGLSHRWEVQQEGGRVHVTCVVTHERGHAETVRLDGAPDNSGKKNAIQQVASTITYLQRYSLLAIVGLATKDEDNDGAGGADDDGGVEISALCQSLIDTAKSKKTDAAVFDFWKANKAQLANYPNAYREFTDAVAAHRKHLGAKPTAKKAAA